MTNLSLRYLNYTLVLLAILAITFLSCRKDENFITSGARFSLSQDTLLFDTVFTTIGSATKRIKVYNEESDPIQINVRLQNGVSSMWRMNANGFQGHTLEGLEIPAGDSIYVFLEVTVNPDNPLSLSPFVIEEDLVVEQASSQKNLKLIAWGQNANYLSRKGDIRGLTCGGGSITFDDPKPYVIYGILVIDSCEVVIPAGANIYVHGGVIVNDNGVYNDGQIIVFPNGKLTVNGELDNPVYFEGSRLEPDFDQVPGQWVGIRIWKESQGNRISHARIKNSIIGVIADSSSTLLIDNTIIKNTSGPGIIGSHANISGHNLLLYEIGTNGIQLGYGGQYQFDYCTIVNSSGQSEALYANNYICTDPENDPLCQSAYRLNPIYLAMTNSILYGNDEDEIIFDDYTGGMEPDQINFDLNNCIVKVDELLDAEAYPNFFDNCINCLNLKRDDLLFRNIDSLDFRLDTMSIAIEKGISINTISTDILGVSRDGNMPDIGCFEFE